MRYSYCYKSCFLLAFVLMLAGCSQSLTIKVDANVPAPLIAQLPLNVGVFYTEDFSHYIYEENDEERQNWSIDSGVAQVQFFDQMFSSMFNQIKHMDSLDSPVKEKLDAILVPSVEEMQFAIPKETRVNFYEAWIKYRLKLYKNTGDSITELIVTGYGKSSTEFFKSEEKGLKTAINNAYRDIGAKLAINFPKNSAVKQWLSERQAINNANP